LYLIFETIFHRLVGIQDEHPVISEWNIVKRPVPLPDQALTIAWSRIDFCPFRSRDFLRCIGTLGIDHANLVGPTDNAIKGMWKVYLFVERMDDYGNRNGHGILD
jgi:hypothetical protein